MHPLTPIIAQRAKAMAPAPDAVEVQEVRRDERYLRVNIYPGSMVNQGAIIGRGGENIEALRRYVEALAFDLGITVRIKVVTEDRQPTESRQ